MTTGEERPVDSRPFRADQRSFDPGHSLAVSTTLMP